MIDDNNVRLRGWTIVPLDYTNGHPNRVSLTTRFCKHYPTLAPVSCEDKEESAGDKSVTVVVLVFAAKTDEYRTPATGHAVFAYVNCVAANLAFVKIGHVRKDGTPFHESSWIGPLRLSNCLECNACACNDGNRYA